MLRGADREIARPLSVVELVRQSGFAGPGHCALRDTNLIRSWLSVQAAAAELREANAGRGNGM